MRKLGNLVTAIACLMLATQVFAADTPAGGGMRLGVDGGVGVPTGDFATATKVGFQLGAFGEYGINEKFALGVGVDYVKLGVTDAVKADVGPDVDVTASILPIMLYGKWAPATQGNIGPYVMAGAGYYMLKIEASTDVQGASYSFSVNDSNPGFFGGLGVDFKSNPQVKLGAFVKMHGILTDDVVTMYVNGGVSVGFGIASK